MKLHSVKTKWLALLLTLAMILPGLSQAMAFAVEGEGEDYGSAVGSTAKFTSTFIYLFSDPENNIGDQMMPLGGSMPELVTITGYYYSGSELFYKVDAAEGYTWPADYANYHYVKASVLEILSTGGEEEKPVKITVDGAPDGAGLSIQEISDEIADAVSDAIVNTDAFTAESYTLRGFDIELINSELMPIQPEGEVTLTLTNIVDTAWELPNVIVYHLLDTAEAITAAGENGTIRTTDDEAVLAAYPEEAQIAAEAGYEGVVAYTVLCSSDETVTIHEDGSISFLTDSFSDYYMASGNMSIGNKEKRGVIEDGTDDVYYTMPGTILYFRAGSFDDPARAAWTVTPADAENVTYNFTNYNGTGSLSIEDDFVPDADGTVFTVTASWRRQIGTVKVVVLNEKAFIEKILEAPGSDNDDLEDYPVYLAVLQNSDTSIGIPAEPGQSGAGYNFIEAGYTTGTDASDVFHSPNGNGIINPDIGEHINFRGSVDGTNTIGLVDPTGVEAIAMLTGINWIRVRDVILALDGIRYDTDGDIIDEENPDDYEAIPYVIKLETTNDWQGWHIDCAIRKKTSVTLTYDNNIPSGMQLNTAIQLPNNVTTNQGSNVTVGAINGMNNGTVEVSMIQNPDAKYTFTFLGWNTAPDGTGTSYAPNSTITLNEDTTLYAIWNSNPALGTGDLLIKKVVSAADGVTIDPNQEFNFAVVVGNAADGAMYHYTVYNANNIADHTGTIGANGTIKLKHGQYALIEDLPAVNDANGTANITVTETVVDGYTAAWTGGTVNGASTSVKIEGGRRSEVTCTNTYTPPATEASLTITKEIDVASDKDESFVFSITGAANMTVVVKVPAGAKTASVTITGFAANDVVTVSELNFNSQYKAAGETTQTLTLTAGENTLRFANDKANDDQWFTESDHASNLFKPE